MRSDPRASRLSLSGRAVPIRCRASITDVTVEHSAERSATSPGLRGEGLKWQRASYANVKLYDHTG